MPKKGYRLTEEHKRKLSLAHIGKKQTLEHIKKAADSKRGKKLSKEHRENISKGKKGKQRSEETKQKLSKWRSGKKHSEATKKKIGLAGIGRTFTKESLLKMSKARKGSKCYNWKGGITDIGNCIRHSFKYRQWRSDVFHRDDFTCQECFNRGGELEAHHIKSFASLLENYNIKSTEEADDCEELWDINNGKTLCKECHKLTDTYAIKKDR